MHGEGEGGSVSLAQTGELIGQVFNSMAVHMGQGSRQGPLTVVKGALVGVAPVDVVPGRKKRDQVGGRLSGDGSDQSAPILLVGPPNASCWV